MKFVPYMGTLRIVKKYSNLVNYLAEVFSRLFLGVTILHKSSFTL